MSDEIPSSPNGSGGGQQQPMPVKENLKNRSTWLRLFFMFVMTLLYAVSRVVVSVVVLLQFFQVEYVSFSNIKKKIRNKIKNRSCRSHF